MKRERENTEAFIEVHGHEHRCLLADGATGAIAMQTKSVAIATNQFISLISA